MIISLETLTMGSVQRILSYYELQAASYIMVNQSQSGSLEDKYLGKIECKIRNVSLYLTKHKLADVSQFGVDLETSIEMLDT